MVDRKKFTALLKFYSKIVGEDLIGVVIADRDGLLLESLIKENKLDAETVGGLSALVEPILKRISTEFKSSGFGAGTFDTEEYRLIFVEAGDMAICVTIIDLLGSIDKTFPYAYLLAEKVARIFNGRTVSPVIPNLELGSDWSLGSGNKNKLKEIVADGNFMFKMILGGDGGVGKTSLVHMFVDGKFSNDYLATIGTSIMKKETKVLDSVVKLVIWDLAGQGQFARVRQTYLKDANCGLLIFDLTRPETFKNIEKWHKETIRGSPDIKLLLIGNKSDLDRKVLQEDAEKLAKKIGIPYFETSALDKDIVNEAFNMLAFKLVQNKIGFA